MVGITLFGLGGLFFVLVPFVDRRAPGPRNPLFAWIGCAVLLYMCVLTYLAYFRPY